PDPGVRRHDHHPARLPGQLAGDERQQRDARAALQQHPGRLMTVLPFRWHGSARLARIEAAVRGHAADWLRDWAAAPARTRGEVALASLRCHAVPAEGECWLVLRPETAGAGTLVLR